MPSPFPGMDPYLEGDLWPDVHHELSSKIRKQLMPLITPKYVARIERYVIEDDAPEAELGIMYPDVEVFLRKQQQTAKEPAAIYAGKTPASPANLTIPIIEPIEVQIPVIEIRDVKNNRLITAIEIISPVNKRPPGLPVFLKKRKKLHAAGVHLLEIDLLRRGLRTVQLPPEIVTDYLIALTRANEAQTHLWTVDVAARLPVVPVPLEVPDADVAIDLQKALDEVYEEAAYHLSINYTAQPPPPAIPQNILTTFVQP